MTASICASVARSFITITMSPAVLSPAWSPRQILLPARPAARRTRRSSANARNARHPAPAARPAAAAIRNDLHDRAADDRGVRDTRRPPRTCSGRLMPKPSATGSASRRESARPAARPSPRPCLACPVTPSREIAYRKPRPSARRLRQPRVGRRRTDEKDLIEPARVERVAHRRGFLDRQIEQQHAVDAGLGGARRRTASVAHAQDRIDVREQDDRRARSVARTSRPDRASRASVATGRQRALRSRAESPGRRQSDPRTARRLR